PVGGSGSSHSELPKAFLPTRGGASPSSSLPCCGASPQTSQWQNGSGVGASGSSTTSASSSVPAGGALHSSGGATESSSSAVKLGSSLSPSSNAAERSANPSLFSVAAPLRRATASLPWPARTLRRVLPSQAGTCSSIRGRFSHFDR